MAKIVIGTEPYWSVPTEEELTPTVYEPSVKKIEDHHGGLTQVKIEANYLNDAGTKVKAGTFQTFIIDNGGQGRVPLLNPRMLARLIQHRAQQYADSKKRKIPFVIWLFGTDANKKDFKFKFQYTLDGTPNDVVDMNGDEDEEEDDDDEEDEDDTDDEDTDDMTDSVPALPIAAAYNSFRERETAALVPSGQGQMAVPAMNPGLDAARVVQLAYGGALQEQRAFIGQIRKDQQINNTELRTTYERAMTLTRDSHNDVLTRVCGAFEKMLEEKQSTLNEIKTIVKETMDFSREQVQQAVTRAQSAEDRLRERDRQDGLQNDRMFEVAGRGWEAFTEGMAMKTDVINERREFDQAFLGGQLQTSQRGQQRSMITGLADRVIPFLPAGLAMFMRSKGDEKSATLVETIASALMPQQQQQQQAQQGYDPNVYVDANEVEDPLPDLCVSVRELRGSLTPAQVSALRTAIPRTAWKNLEEACRTEMETVCFSCLTSLEKFLTSDSAIAGRVQQILGPEQQMRLMSLVLFIKGAAPTVATNASELAAQAQAEAQARAQQPQQPPPSENGATRPQARPFSPPPSAEPTGPRRGVPKRPGTSTPDDEGAT